MPSRRVYLTYPEDKITEPLIYQLGQKFDVVTNIRGASISKEIGLVTLEIEGDDDEMEAALTWLEESGVKVEPIEKTDSV